MTPKFVANYIKAQISNSILTGDYEEASRATGMLMLLDEQERDEVLQHLPSRMVELIRRVIKKTEERKRKSERN